MLQPEPRSACQMVATNDAIYVIGGYSIVNVKGEIYKGQVGCIASLAHPSPADCCFFFFLFFFIQNPSTP